MPQLWNSSSLPGMRLTALALSALSMAALAAAPGPAQAPARPGVLTVALTPAVPTEGARLRWSPKGARVALDEVPGSAGRRLEGQLHLGPAGSPPVRVELTRLDGSAHFDVLRLDLDRDGALGSSEVRLCEPGLTRNKWWSSFEAELTIPQDPGPAGLATSRPYPLSLWFVEDPERPDEPPVLRWSRRGWHEGRAQLDGEWVHVVLTELEMDGVFDQRDCFGVGRTAEEAREASSRSLEGHAWLEGRALRALAIDPHGRELELELFDPGFTEEEERTRTDPTAADRAWPRAKTPLAFSHDLAATLALARESGKRVLIDFETTWCGPCAAMDRHVYSAAPVVEAAEGLLAVKVDGDASRDLVERYGVGAYPTLILLEEDGSELGRRVGYQSVADLVAWWGS